jgi:DNA-binding transcriptional regulator GbsR (MarR family)
MKKRENAGSEEKFRDIEQRLIDIITKFGYLKGRSAKTSEVLAYVYLREEVTQQLLRELTGYSLGTVSTALQDLEKLGFVRKQLCPNARGYLYRLAGAPSQVLSRSMSDFQGYLAQIRDFLEEVEGKLNKPSLSKKRGFGALKRFLDEMNVLIPAYQQILEKFQKAPLSVGKKGEV